MTSENKQSNAAIERLSDARTNRCFLTVNALSQHTAHSESGKLLPSACKVPRQNRRVSEALKDDGSALSSAHYTVVFFSFLAAFLQLGAVLHVKSCLITGATNTVTRMKDPPKRGETHCRCLLDCCHTKSISTLSGFKRLCHLCWLLWCDCHG